MGVSPLSTFTNTLPEDGQVCITCDEGNTAGLTVEWRHACGAMFHKTCLIQEVIKQRICPSCRDPIDPTSLRSLRGRISRALTSGIEGDMLTTGITAAGTMFTVCSVVAEGVLGLGPPDTLQKALQRLFIGGAAVAGGVLIYPISKRGDDIEPTSFHKVLGGAAVGGAIGALGTLKWALPNSALFSAVGAVVPVTSLFLASQRPRCSSTLLAASFGSLIASAGMGALIHPETPSRAEIVFGASVMTAIFAAPLSLALSVPFVCFGICIGIGLPDLRSNEEREADQRDHQRILEDLEDGVWMS